jgi:S1-C subfamily serine protease
MKFRSPRSLFAVTYLAVTFVGYAGLIQIALAAATAGPAPTPAQPTSAGSVSAPNKSVVRVLTTVQTPSPLKPWSRAEPAQLVSSGIVIEEKRILCNAHSLLYAERIQVEPGPNEPRLAATIQTIAPGIDLALLTVKDDALFDSHPPLARQAALPSQGDEVFEFGFPPNGDRLSAAKGTVSLIEYAAYNYPISGLRVQVNYSFNPDNSGGPVLLKDKMIGLAHAYRGGPQNTGFVIPSEEIASFLKDAERGRVDSRPALLDELQTLDNANLRTYLKLPPTVHGMMAHKPASADPGYPLKEWDVICKVGDFAVDDQGMIQTNNLKVRFQYLTQFLARDGKLPMTVFRAGREVPIELPLGIRPMLIEDLEGKQPPYFICGPMAFTTVSIQFVDILTRGTAGNGIMGYLSAFGSPLAKRIGDTPAFEGEELVVVPAQFFDHPLARGYSDPRFQVVKTINGVPIRNLKHLIEVVRESKDDFLSIQFDSRHSETLVFPRADMIRATAEILAQERISAQGSAEVMAVWNAKAAK